MNNINEHLRMHEEDVFRLLNYSNHTEAIAKQALNNIIIPYPGFEEVEFNEELWETTKKEKYGNTYILYIHTLRVCAELLNHYEKSQEKVYFEKAEQIINAWIKYSNNEEVADIVWYDHTTANRSQVLTQYLYHAKKLGRKIDVPAHIKLLHQHASVMMDDKIYKTNNHGLMMDKSLMILGNILSEEKYTYKGKTRAKDTFWFSFSSQGIHLENSPQYHNMVVRMYSDIEKYLNLKEDSLGGVVRGYLELAKMYTSYIQKPDKRLANIGDSGSGIQRTPKLYDNFYDREAGIAILQHPTPVPHFLTFICGYSSIVHKHKDDLSITLNYNHEDFFVDAGKYSYTRNKTREYITSRKAHSGFYMSQFDYKIKNENRFTRKVSLDNYYENEKFTFVKGYHHDYEGSSAKLIRHIVQFKEKPLTILIDNVEMMNNYIVKLTQNFNLASNVSITEEDSIKLTVNKTSLTLKQFNADHHFKIVDGNENVPVAVNTSGFGKVEPTRQLQFETRQNQGNAFLTAIYDEEFVKNLNVTRTESTVKISFNDIEYFIYI